MTTKNHGGDGDGDAAIAADRAAMAPGEWETRVRIFEMLECAAARVAAQQAAQESQEPQEPQEPAGSGAPEPLPPGADGPTLETGQ